MVLFMNIIFSLHIVLLLSLSSFSVHAMKREQPISSTQRKHSKIKIKNLIIQMLEDKKYEKIIIWLIKDKVFSVNLGAFHAYYIQRTGTSKIDMISIKNAFSKSKNNIVKLPEEDPHHNWAPVGYDRSYRLCPESISKEMLREAVSEFNSRLSTLSINDPNITNTDLVPNPDITIPQDSVHDHNPINNQFSNIQINNYQYQIDNNITCPTSNNITCYQLTIRDIKNTVDDQLIRLFGQCHQYSIDGVINRLIESGLDINRDNLKYLFNLATNNSDIVEYHVLKNIITFLGPLHLLPTNMKILANSLRVMFHGFINYDNIDKIKIISNNKCRLLYIVNKPNSATEELPLACLCLVINDKNIIIHIFKEYWCNGYFIYAEKDNIITKKIYPDMKGLVDDVARDYEDYTSEDISYNFIPDAPKYMPLNKVTSDLIVSDDI